MLAYFYLWIERSFGDINFYFPVEQINIEAWSIHTDAVSIGVEYVANYLAVRKGVIADKLLNCPWNLVRSAYQKLASRIGEEFAVDVALDLRLVPDLESFAGRIDFAKKTVHIRISVKISP